MKIKASRVIGFYEDGPAQAHEFTLEALDRKTNPRCRITIVPNEFNLAEWLTLSESVVMAFQLVSEES